MTQEGSAPDATAARTPTSGGPVSLLPTPTVGDSRGSRNATSGRTNPESKHHAGTTLCDVVFSGELLPTPRASDTGTPGRRAGEGWGPPLSQVVIPLTETSTGAATSPPSSDGKQSRDSAPPGQLTLTDD